MNDWRKKAQHMVTTQLKARDINNPKVIQAFLNIPRHRFVSPQNQSLAYADHALSIGHNVTISQPYTVAKSVQLAFEASLNYQHVLDIGSGSGYQSAILSQLYQKVTGIEIIQPLVKKSRRTLEELTIDNVTIKHADATEKIFPNNHFSAIIVAANAQELPSVWAKQLKDQGVIVCPIKNQLKRFTKTQKGLTQEAFGLYRFVPLKNT